MARLAEIALVLVLCMFIYANGHKSRGGGSEENWDSGRGGSRGWSRRNKERWVQLWGSKGSWSKSGESNEERYDRDSDKWWRYDRNRRDWVEAKGDHFVWDEAREGDERQDRSDGNWYRYHNGRWIWLNKNSWATKSSQRWRTQWGSKRSWRQADYVNEERCDADSGQWYRYDGRRWAEADGDHFNWDDGREGEERQDRVNDLWYRFHDGRWVYFNNNSWAYKNKAKWQNRWARKSFWTRGKLNEERYNKDDSTWYRYDGSRWVEAKGDHLSWEEGRENEERQERFTNSWYRYKNGRWLWIDRKGSSNVADGSSESSETFDRTRWGPKRNWRDDSASSEEERYDTDSNAWYQYKQGRWIRARGKHLGWGAGRENENRQDDYDGRVYVYHHGWWQREKNRS